MYRVKGKTQTNLGEFEKEFETIEEAEEWVRKMAITYGIEAKLIEISECCKYKYSYNSERYRVMQLLDQYGVQYKVDKFLNIKIEF